MVTLDQANELFADMVAKSGKKFEIDEVFLVLFDEPLYMMLVTDENGDQLLPGEAFPAIREADGALIDCRFPCPGAPREDSESTGLFNEQMDSNQLRSAFFRAVEGKSDEEIELIKAEYSKVLPVTLKREHELAANGWLLD